MKVKDIPYSRYEITKVEEIFKKATKAVKEAKNANEVIAAHDLMLDCMKDFGTMVTVTNIRFSLDSSDEFYLNEREYYDGVIPVYTELYNDFGKAMLASPFADEVKKVVSPIVFEKYRMLALASDSRIIEDKKEEAEIVVEYNKLMSDATFEFRGETMPLSVLRGKLSDDDRNVRKEACYAIGNGLKKHAAQLDDIYDRLVHVRDRMAKKLGYKNYIELGYLNMERFDYDRDMIETFRRSVQTDLVPVISKMKTDRAKKLGIDKPMFYDDDVYFTDGEPRPIIDADEIFRQGQLMYDDMSPETGRLFRKMVEEEAFDVLSRKGKWGGGCCTNLEGYKQIFILANFNGSSDDIDVITHEFGHALAMDMAFEGEPEVSIGGNETAECHSMSMEFLCWPYMERFFGKNADKYRYKHLLASLAFIPYGCIVDEFQHIAYDNPDLTPAERKEEYLKLERKYRPYIDYSGIPYYEEGIRWQYQMHIFETPFYYIDYCLAQTISLEFLVESRVDYGKAFAKYLDFCKAGGSVPFSKLCEKAGLVSPFAEGALKQIAKVVPEILKELE